MDKQKVGRLVGVVLLVALGLVAVIVGLGYTWISNCCGSPDPSDPLPAIVGVLVCLGFVVLAILLSRRD